MKEFSLTRRGLLAGLVGVTGAALVGEQKVQGRRVGMRQPPIDSGIQNHVGSDLHPAVRSPIVEAPRDSRDVPPHVRAYLESMAVSVHGTTSGFKIMIKNKLAGIVACDHGMPSYDRTAANPTLPTYGLQIRTGSVAFGTDYLIADDLVTYPDADLAFLAFPGYTADQVAQKYFQENGGFNWDTVPDGSRIYFAGYPYSFESPTTPNTRPRQSFAMAYLGTSEDMKVMLSPVGSQYRLIDVVGATMNLTQDGYGCLVGSSGSIGVYFDDTGKPHLTGALTAFSTLAPGRETIVDNVTYDSGDAIERQIQNQERWGVKPMGDLVCSFSDPRTPGPQVNVRFVNGR